MNKEKKTLLIKRKNKKSLISMNIYEKADKNKI